MDRLRNGSGSDVRPRREDDGRDIFFKSRTPLKQGDRQGEMFVGSDRVRSAARRCLERADRLRVLRYSSTRGIRCNPSRAVARHRRSMKSFKVSLLIVFPENKPYPATTHGRKGRDYAAAVPGPKILLAPTTEVVLQKCRTGSGDGLPAALDLVTSIRRRRL